MYGRCVGQAECLWYRPGRSAPTSHQVVFVGLGIFHQDTRAIAQEYHPTRTVGLVVGQ